MSALAIAREYCSWLDRWEGKNAGYHWAKVIEAGWDSEWERHYNWHLERDSFRASKDLECHILDLVS